MTKWNEALAAYDEECPILEDIREEYGAFLRSTFDAIGKLVVDRAGAEWAGKLRGDGPKTSWTAQPRSVGLTAWTPRAWGGPRESLAAAVTIDVREGFSVKDGEARRQLFLAAADERLGVTRGEKPDAAELGEHDPIVVRCVTTRTRAGSDKGISERTADLIDLAIAVDGLVSQCAWLKSVLEGLLSESPPASICRARPTVAWQDKKLKRWASGWYIELDQGEELHVWACARPPGLLVLGFYADEDVAQTLGEKLGAKAMTIEGESDVRLLVLMSTDRVADAFKKSDVKAVRKRVVEAFELFFTLVK